MENNFHPRCSKRMFGLPEAPTLPYDMQQMEQLALHIIQSKIAVTGVQPKLSLDIEKAEKNTPKKLTIVGLWGQYILKPPSTYYPQLPEVEDLTMHLADITGIAVVPHCLIPLASGGLAYITRRIDRIPKKPAIHMEDMCQITDRLTEHKYRGSYEQIAKAILAYSVNPGLDLVNLCEELLFCFITGNSDMHLKNFSLIQRKGNEFVLSPAYDMVATALVNPEDKEETALTLNGKKSRLTHKDFVASFTKMGLDAKQIDNVFKKMERSYEKWLACIEISFLSEEYKDAYIKLIDDRMARMGIVG